VVSEWQPRSSLLWDEGISLQERGSGWLALSELDVPVELPSPSSSTPDHMIPTLPKVELGISVPFVPYLRVGTRLSMHARSTGFPFPVPLSALLSLGRDWASVPDRVGGRTGHVY
jgi:hypothetical protein